MVPESNEIRHFSFEFRRRHHRHALKDLREIAQIERVVRLGRRRKQLRRYRVVDGYRRVDDTIRQRRRVGKDGEPIGENRRENALLARVFHFDEREMIEVARETKRYGIATAARRAHGADEADVDQLAKLS